MRGYPFWGIRMGLAFGRRRVASERADSVRKAVKGRRLVHGQKLGNQAFLDERRDNADDDAGEMIGGAMKLQSRFIQITLVQEVLRRILGGTMELIGDAAGFQPRKNRKLGEGEFQGFVAAGFDSNRDAIDEIHGALFLGRIFSRRRFANLAE